MSENERVIICMKWGTLYSSEYVNVLYSAVKANITGPFRFVCLTDDTTGIFDCVECYSIPDIPAKDVYKKTGSWPKLTVFKQDLYGLKGRALFIDLDSVILGKLDGMFEVEGEIVLIREWKRFIDYFRRWKINGQTSIFAFDLGKLSYLYNAFMADPSLAMNSFRSEQRFVTHHAKEMVFWNHPQIISFKRHLLAAPLLNRWVKPKLPPQDTKVLVFHGVPRPIDVVPDENQRWGSFFRYGRGTVHFVRRYWLLHSCADRDVKKC